MEKDISIFMETKLNFKSSICTSREQIERFLALGLKKETADCVLIPSCNWDGTDVIRVGALHLECKLSIPAWSLHRLWELIPKVVFKNPALHLTMCSNSIFYCTEDNNEDYEKPFSAKLNLYDNIIECIEWLIKEGYFNKEYLV